MEQILGDHFINVRNISNSEKESKEELDENGLRLLIAKETARSLIEWKLPYNAMRLQISRDRG